jgi:uncharacterized protein YfaS (alpha-2-macroglobulin family)
MRFILRRLAALFLLLGVLYCCDSASADRTINLEAPHNFPPNKKVLFQVSGEGIDAARLQVWQVVNGSKGPQRGKLVYTGAKKRSKDEENIIFYVPLLQAGVYVAEAQHGLLLQTTSLRVTDIGLITKRAPHEMLIYAVRMTDGLPFPNVRLRVVDSGVYNREKKQWTRKPLPTRTLLTGKDGVVRIAQTPGDGYYRIAATQAGNYTQTQATVESLSDNTHKLLFYTERPIYRPGQKVFFKGIVRRDLGLSGQRDKGNIYAPAANRTVQVEVTDAANNVIGTQQLRTNARGTFAGSTELLSEAPIGRYSVEIKLLPASAKESSESFYGRFAVQAYRKPEYEAIATPILPNGKPWAVQGEKFKVRINARYFFGAPVTDATVKYTGDVTGETKLDEQGEATIEVANGRDMLDEKDKTLSIQFQVIDSTNRIVQTTVSVPAPRSEIKPELEADRYAYNLRDVAKFSIFTHDPAGRPVAAKTRLTLFYYRRTSIKHPDSLRVETRTDRVAFFRGTVQTDKNGEGAAQVRLGRAGYIDCELEATDSAGRNAKYQNNFWVLSEKEKNYYGYEFPDLQIELDQDEYKPGDAVRALVTTDHPGRVALVTLESDRIFWHRIIRLTSRAMPIDFRLPVEAAPGAHLTIGFPGEESWTSDSEYINAQDPLKKLQIGVYAKKPQYKPGETASYTIVAKDGAGRPVPAEVSLSFVDKAIYSLAADETPEPYDFFYGQRPLRVATQYFLPRELEGGSYQRIEKPVAVRQKFEDTAYWNPFVVIGADGRATLNFPLPDNLTTWRSTARGITSDTKTGVGYAETLVTKPLLVRLTLPRFYVQGDSAQALVVVNNNTKQSQTVRVSLKSEEAGLVPNGTEVRGAQNGTVPAGKSTTFRWTVALSDVPKNGKVAFIATARADAAAGTSIDDSTDAMKLTVPVLPRGVRVQQWEAGQITGNDSTASLTLARPSEAIANATQLEIQFAPSMAGPMLAALPELQGYPYGCTEQTLSRFVPTVVAARALRKLGKPLPPEMQELPKMVQAGLTVLAGYQHDDGGWGWWREDDTDPFMTGYTVYGLTLAKEAGFKVDRPMLIRGLRSIQNQFRKDSQSRSQVGNEASHEREISADVRAWMMLGYTTAIAAADVTPAELESTDDFPRAVFAQREKLSNYSLAALAVAYARATEIAPPKGKAKALVADPRGALSTLLALLETRAKSETTSTGPSTFWPSLADDGGWRDSDIETTALAVQALVRGKPNSPLVVTALRWLLHRRTGKLWDSTKDSAQAVISLADYLQNSAELQPDETVRVLVNGVEKAKVRFTAEDIAKADRSLRITDLEQDANITVERAGRGAVYFSARLTAYTRAGLDQAADNGLAVERHYAMWNNGKWVDTATIPNGALVRVELRVTTTTPREYVLIEDPLPSGFEVQEDDLVGDRAWPEADESAQWNAWQEKYGRLYPTRTEVRDDRVALFASSLWDIKKEGKPRSWVYRYILRPEQTGTRTALPTRAELMYRPDINGRGTQNSLEVR